MKLEKKLLFTHKLGNCEFRTISEKDISEDYLMGLREESKYIKYIPENVNRTAQAQYIRDIIDSERNTICGLFLNSELIGTAGIQNISEGQKVSIGFLLFNKTLRGNGFGKVLVWASCFLTNSDKMSTVFFAGMKKENLASLKACLSCGFIVNSESLDAYIVELLFKDLQIPTIIGDINVL
ncbi:MAG: GNAT family N-acetyltransferase [bacterium]|nr:GNAT family N-acetyltransferase [bacterium]